MTAPAPAPEPQYNGVCTIKRITPVNAGRDGIRLKLKSASAKLSGIVDGDKCVDVFVPAASCGLTATDPPMPTVYGVTIQQEQAFIFMEKNPGNVEWANTAFNLSSFSIFHSDSLLYCYARLCIMRHKEKA